MLKEAVAMPGKMSYLKNKGLLLNAPREAVAMPGNMSYLKNKGMLLMLCHCSDAGLHVIGSP